MGEHMGASIKHWACNRGRAASPRQWFVPEPVVSRQTLCDQLPYKGKDSHNHSIVPYNYITI